MNTLFNYGIGDTVAIDPEDYPLLPKETAAFLKKFEGKPLRVEKRFAPGSGDVGYYNLSHDGEIIEKDGNPFPFIDADLKPFGAKM